MSKDKKFKVGDFVFAKVRGYPAWPARISSITDPRPAFLKYNVYFFGTSERAVLLSKEICSYTENKEKLGKPVKRKFFQQGLDEIEREIKKVEAGEESTLGLNLSVDTGAEDGAPKKKIRKSKIENSLNDTTEEETQGARGRSLKRKRESNMTADEGEETSKKKRNSLLKPKSNERNDSPPKPEQISRSGRVIKPKKFLYDEEGEDPENKNRPQKVQSAVQSPAVTETRKEKDKENSRRKSAGKSK